MHKRDVCAHKRDVCMHTRQAGHKSEVEEMAVANAELKQQLADEALLVQVCI